MDYKKIGLKDFENDEIMRSQNKMMDSRIELDEDFENVRDGIELECDEEVKKEMEDTYDYDEEIEI